MKKLLIKLGWTILLVVQLVAMVLIPIGVLTDNAALMYPPIILLMGECVIGIAVLLYFAVKSIWED